MKNWKRILGLLAFILPLIFGYLSVDALSQSEKNVAVVCFLEGKAWSLEPGKKERSEVSLFDWIKIGTVIQTETKTRIVLAFSTGDRYELKGRTKITVGQKGIASSTGSVKKLTSVPVMPKIAAISKESKPGSRLGGIRLRGSKRPIYGLYPSEGATVIAEEAILTFNPVDGVKKYRVEIKDESGKIIFTIDTGYPKVATYPPVLKPGANYIWKVQSLDKEPPIFSEAAFSTVNEENAQAWTAFKERAYQSKDGVDLLLLAQMEIALGLKKEASETLKTALELFPDNEEIKKAIFQMGIK